MSITLLQQNSFEFDGRATRNIFPTKNKIGIDCVIKCVEEKLKLKDDIKQHVLFLKGRTGSGKSTCMPVKLFEHFSKNPSLIQGNNLRVLVTENRVILSTSIAVDNCNIPGTFVKYGINTGYATGQGKTVIQNPSYLLYISTELFKRRLIQRLPLPQIIVIDECHEMELYLIELLYHIKQYLNDKTIPTNKKPLFIFASATLDLDRMIKYFFDNTDDVYKDALMINYIAGSRNYPVDEYYLTKEEENKLDINQFVQDVLTKKLEISIKSDQVVKNNIPARDMLIFTYGGAGLKIFEYDLVKKYCKYPCYVSTVLYDDTSKVLEWRQRYQNRTRVLILPYNARCLGFASKLLVNNHDLDEEAQQHEIKIYISTNAIETGKTIITLYQVFDVGLRFYKMIRPLTHHIPHTLTKVPVNKSSTIQRCGRVGRTCKGKAYRMFSKDTYELLEDNDTPGNIFTISLGYQVIGAKTERLQLLETNDYVQTNPLDLMIATGQDLCQAGYYTPFGELINDIRDVDTIDNWVSEAEYHYYTNPKVWNDDEGIYNLLFTCRLNRSNLGENTSYSGQTSENRKFVYDSESILSAYDARQMYVKYKLGLSNIFRQKVLE